MRRFLVLAVLLAAPAWGQVEVFRDIAAADLPTCNASRDGKAVAIVDAFTVDDVDTTGGGAVVAPAICDNGTGWRGLSRGLSFNNAPASPSAYNNEFAGALGWTWTNPGGGSAAPAAGTIDPMGSISGDPKYDLTSWPGWLLVQSDESTASTLLLSSGAVTVDTNATFVAEITFPNIVFSAAGEGSVYLWVDDSGDTNETVATGLVNTAGTGFRCRGRIENNGSAASNDGVEVVEATPAFNRVLLWLFKTGDSWASACSFGDMVVPTPRLAAQTKTGVTTLNRISIRISTADETPSVVWGINSVRYFGSNTLAVMGQ